MKKLRGFVLAAVAVGIGLTAVASATGRTAANGRIVFVRDHLCQDGNDCGLGEVATVNADGSGLRILTHDKVTEYSPRWSPNRQQIAFIRPRPPDGSAQVWVMNADGTHQRQVTRLSGTLAGIQFFADSSSSRLDWSPDGQEIVFAAYPPDPQNDGGPRHLYLANIRTGAVTALTSGSSMTTDDDDPAWSPNGRWIAFLRAPSRVMLVSPTTHRLRELTYRGASLDASGLAWSPDGRHLAFNSHGKIAVINTDGTHLHSLGVLGWQPSWSRDGQWIVFSSGGNVAGLAEVRPNGTGHHLITHLAPKWLNFEPDW
jgi:Tol biopolymer transport system component